MQQLKKPYVITVYLKANKRIIELRPRHGIWNPFIFSISFKQLEQINPELHYGKRNNIEEYTQLKTNMKLSADNFYYTFYSENIVSKNCSFYIECDKLPSFIIFGQLGEEYYKTLTK